MSWGVKTTCFKAPGVSLGGSGVSIGGVRIIFINLFLYIYIYIIEYIRRPPCEKSCFSKGPVEFTVGSNLRCLKSRELQQKL